MWGKTAQIYQLKPEYQRSQNFLGRMIRFNTTGDPGGVLSSLSSGSEKAPRLLEWAGGSLLQFTGATEEEINSSHWWLGVITDSQFKQFKEADSGVKTSRAGEGRPFKQGEIGEGEFTITGGGELLRCSGDSNSLSKTWMSALILCANGGRCEWEGALGTLIPAV